MAQELYNHQEILQYFQSHLNAENINKHTVRNYLSDLDHFFGWLSSSHSHVNELVVNKGVSAFFSLPSENISFILKNYKNYLINFFELSTINRRLSSLRKFFQFLLLTELISMEVWNKILFIFEQVRNLDNSKYTIILDDFEEEIMKDNTDVDFKVIKDFLTA